MKTREEKTSGNEIVIENRFLRWLDNFWYHYKWHVIIIAFFVFVGAVSFTQCTQREEGDVTLVFAGSTTLNAEQHKNVVDVFNAVAPKDKDEKQLTTLLTQYSVYTEEEMKKACTNEDGTFSPSAFASFKQVTQDHLKTFGTYVMTGESGIWLVSEYVYEVQNLKKLAKPLNELFESVPEGAFDDYAIRLADTEIYQYYDALKVLPEDTLIVMSQPLVMGQIADEAIYQEFLDTYYTIVNFKAP